MKILNERRPRIDTCSVLECIIHRSQKLLFAFTLNCVNGIKYFKYCSPHQELVSVFQLYLTVYFARIDSSKTRSKLVQT